LEWIFERLHRELVDDYIPGSSGAIVHGCRGADYGSPFDHAAKTIAMGNGGRSGARRRQAHNAGYLPELDSRARAGIASAGMACSSLGSFRGTSSFSLVGHHQTRFRLAK